jgi:hypothetical protein
MMSMRRLPALLVCLVIAGSIVVADAASRPDANTQPLADGCMRSDALITLTIPEWVYVNRQEVLAARLAGDTVTGRKTAEGVIREIHPAGDDQFITHDYGDVDIDIGLDEPFQYLSGTGNGEEGVGNLPDIGTEWEDTLIPTWAWPQIGDRVRESGAWIWDCGHWGNGGADPTMGFAEFIPYDPVETIPDLTYAPDTLKGESTELHPLDQVATWRKDAAGILKGQRNGTELKRLDIWVGGDGGGALAEEECALYGLPPAAILALESTKCPRTRDVGGTYTYKIDLGPKPKPGSKMVVNDLIVRPDTDKDLAAGAAKNVKLTKDVSAGTVTVTFELPHRTAPAVHFGITVEAGWTGARAAVHHVVRIDKFTVHATLDGPSEPNIHFGQTVGPEQTPDPGEWVMFAAVNGQWRRFSPTMKSRTGHPFNQVTAGDVYDNVLSFDFWLPQGVEPTLYVSGRECDIPLIDCRKDDYGGPPTDLLNPFVELGFNDKPGRVQLGDGGLPMTIGSAVYEPRVNPSATSSSEDLSDHSCGGPCYTVVATAR